MTFFGICGLLIFIYMRPHEFVPALASLQLLYPLLLIAIIGIFLDVGARKSRFVSTPQLRIVMMMWFWCLLTLAVRRPDLLASKAINISVSVTLYLVVAYGVQAVPRFMKTTLVIFGLGFFVAAVAVNQGTRPFTCIEIIPGTENAKGVPTEMLCPMVGPEGETLDGRAKCVEDGMPGMAYVCEKPGWFGTFSVQGRVRYLGVLMDPNEVALATSMAIPFAFSFFEQRRSLARLLLLITTLALVGTGVVFSQSRGGQIVFSAVLGAYFMKKYGVRRGVLVAATLAVPLMMAGGRSGEEAEQSSLERLEAAAAGIKMFLQYPVTGVGMTQFTDHHNLTAHNAYILSVGELGLPGMWLFITLLMTSIRIPIAVLQHPLVDAEVAKVQSLAMAMLATFGGALIGIFFLSWTYHYVLWIHFGLAGSLYLVIKAKDPTFEVPVTRRHVGMALGICVLILVALTIHTKRKHAW
jgi:O-Antigen ligase